MKSVLIVDDDEDIRDVVKGEVEEVTKDIRIDEADSGLTALEKIKKNKYDLLITDLKMPDMDGQGLIHALVDIDASHRPDQILVMSAYLEAESMGRTMGRTTYISKPFNDTAFKGYLSNVLLGSPMEDSGRAQGHVDLQIMDPFIAATKEVFEITCATDVTAKDVPQKALRNLGGDITGLMPLISKDLDGSVALTFEKDCFLKIVTRMTGEEYTDITSVNQDAVAELCGQIYRQAREKLNASGYDFKTSIPSVITGDTHSVRHVVNGPCRGIQFNSDAGKFYLVVAQVVQKVVLA